MNINVHRLTIPHHADETIDAPEEAAMLAALSQKLRALLDVLPRDYRNDHTARHISRRVANKNVGEFLRTRPTKSPAIGDFDNAEQN